ncbi:MAG TPA: MFS transporter [Bryobacteraceae bacterium]|nr:MFS transporter [Bryobacteraceae bacterium]
MSEYNVREQRGWYLYDWANSAFPTTVIALFLGPYITVLAKAAADSQGFIHPLGIKIDARSYWSYLISLSVILQVLFLPIVGAIADYGRKKRECLAATAYLGALATAAMFFLHGTQYHWGGALFLIANVSFGASIVVYNSFLPEIAPPEQRDAVSSRGWGIGYLGGGLLLALNLALYQNAARIGLTEGLAVRISLSSAGIWWGLFTIPTLITLRNRGAMRALTPGQRAIRATLGQLRGTVREILRYPQTTAFLIAYLLYNDAIQAVLALAAQFGNDELKIPVSQLTLAILMVQFVGFFGAIGFQWIAARTGAKRAILASLVLWTATLIYIYAEVKTTLDFFVAAAVIALVMGGSQALSRSLFAQLIPQGKEAEYFSIYEVSDKGTSWLCPMLFGLALQFTRSYRMAILSLIVFFIAGLIGLLRVDVARGEREALVIQEVR